jgi:hypothetical protein
MKPYFFLSTLLCVVFAVSCSNKKIAKVDMPAYSLVFGKTGGFTNLNPQYIFYGTGELYKKDMSNESPVLVKKVDATVCHSIYKLTQSQNILELKVNYTANITYYIEYHQGSLFNRIQWGNESQITPEIKQLHELLLELLKT